MKKNFDVEPTFAPTLSIWGLRSYGFLYFELLSFPINAVITSVILIFGIYRVIL